MLTIIHANDLDLPDEVLGEGYSGPETYRNKNVYQTPDDTVTIGVWSYDGTFRSGTGGRHHHVWVVTAGRVEVEAEGVVCAAGVGDALVFEAPYGPKHRVSASADFRAIWLTVKGEANVGN